MHDVTTLIRGDEQLGVLHVEATRPPVVDLEHRVLTVIGDAVENEDPVGVAIGHREELAVVGDTLDLADRDRPDLAEHRRVGEGPGFEVIPHVHHITSTGDERRPRHRVVPGRLTEDVDDIGEGAVLRRHGRPHVQLAVVVTARGEHLAVGGQHRILDEPVPEQCQVVDILDVHGEVRVAADDRVGVHLRARPGGHPIAVVLDEEHRVTGDDDIAAVTTEVGVQHPATAGRPLTRTGL